MAFVAFQWLVPFVDDNLYIPFRYLQNERPFALLSFELNLAVEKLGLPSAAVMCQHCQLLVVLKPWHWMLVSKDLSLFVYGESV